MGDSSVLLLALSSLVCGYVDSTLGMGYGTTLSPILIAGFGYSPFEVVPSILFSQLIGGILGAIAHHRVGNVRLTPGERPFAVAMVLAACSIGGAFVAVKVATGIPEWTLKMLIAVIVLAMGIMILLLRDYRRRFTWRKIAVLGAVASFNKVVSGGGYGPVIVAGQVVSGIDAKNAIGITSLAEALTCVSGLAAYALGTGRMPWGVAIPMAVGAALAVPLAAVTVKLIPAKRFTLAVGAATLILGGYAVCKSWPDFARWMAS